MFNEYVDGLHSLAVFRGILKNDTVGKLLAFLSQPSIDAYGSFVGSLYEYGDSLTDFLIDTISDDENPFLKGIAGFEHVPYNIYEAARNEMSFLQKLSQFTSEEAWAAVSETAPPAKWSVYQNDLYGTYCERINAMRTTGFGMFARYHVFVFRDGKLVPVKNPDPQSLSQLSGYETERGKVIANTMALLNGDPALNVLLYGDAGTGKSSTVKAIANEYMDMGLRLIELTKAQLGSLPEIIEMIADNPLRFIIFIDDISFSADDDNFSALKAVLEGSAAAKTPNMSIYCTSNRRHIVRERFSDRSGDDVHASDTREEQISLSERFGLKVAFLKPDKDTYLQIVESLANEYGIECDAELFTRAEAYALRRSGRSGRAAKHFIELEAAGNMK